MFEDPQSFGKLPGRQKQSMVGQINPIGRRRESYIDAKLSQSIASCKLGLTTTSYSVYRLCNGTCLYKIWAFAGWFCHALLNINQSSPPATMRARPPDARCRCARLSPAPSP